MATLTVSGQTRKDLPTSMLDTDEKVRAYLSTFMPDAGTAEITRTVSSDGDLQVTVIKRAGPKGATTRAARAIPRGRARPTDNAPTRTDPREQLRHAVIVLVGDSLPAAPLHAAQQRILAALDAAPETVNPALALCWRLDEREAAGTLSLALLTRLGLIIARAEERGGAEAERISRTLAALRAAPAVPLTGAVPDSL